MIQQLKESRFWFIVVVTVLSILGVGQHHVQAQTPEDSPTYGESYIVGLDDTFAPMGFRDASGEIVGFDIDLANAVAEIYNWDLTFQPIDWSLKETELNSGNIDMIWNGYGVTPQREEQVLMSEPYIESGQVIVTKNDSGIETLEDLEGRTIATQSGSTAIDFMQNWPNDLYNQLAEEPVLYPDYNQVFADLEAGRVDAIYAGGVYARYVLSQRDDAEDYTIFDDPTSMEPMAVGLRKSDSELKEAIDNGLATLKENGTYDELYAKWFGGTEVEAASTEALVPEESPTYGESYIVGLDDTFAPMGFRNNEGELVGFDIDLANQVAEIYNWDLTFQPIDWSLKETELNSGNIDMIWNGYGVTPQREEQVLMSEPYIISAQVIVSKKDSGITELEDLEGRTIATQSGSTAVEFMQNWPNDLYNRLAEEPVLYPDYNQVFADLEAGRVDAIYAGGVYARYVLSQRDDAEDYYIFDDPTSMEPMAVGMRKSDTDLKAAVDNGIAALKENGTYDEIYAQWFGETDTEATPTEEGTESETENEGEAGNASVAEAEEENLIVSIMPALLDGLKLTLFIFVVVLIVSVPLGFIIAVLRVFGPNWLQALIEGYVFVMRGSPLMLQLMIVFFGLPFIGISMDRLPAALFAYIINYSAYFTEIFRGGISSVPKGQFESISVLGIGRLRGFMRIILPQVFNIVMPSVGNEIISLVKDTSLVYVIGLGELLRAGSIAANREASLMPYLAVGVIYLILTAVLTYVLRRLEKRMEW